MGAAEYFEAARLSSWGLGLLLLYIAGSRVLNALHWTAHRRGWLWVPRVEYDPPRWSSSTPTTFFSALFAMIPLFAFTPAILAKHVVWLEVGQTPAASIVAVWLLCVVSLFLLWKLAFRPARKLAIGCGWVLLSHGIAWIQVAGP